jgi:hypothetical protein
LVVCSVRGSQPLTLPGSRIVAERTFISGGERSLYETATAAAVAGIDVELRGDLHPAILGAITSAAGAAPTIGLEPRRPAPGDVVVVPEALPIDEYAPALLSGARWAIHLLAPPGLWGWSFVPGWEPPDPVRVPLASIGRPETFRAIADAGFYIWTNARGTAAAAHAAGVDARWLGTGTPVPFPVPGDKAFDVALVEGNRWQALAEEVLARLPDLRVLRVKPEASVYYLSNQLAPAHILIWPSRIEGMSRIAREARAVGTVPVALDTNPFATPEDHGPGVVLVADTDQMEREIRALLDDPIRLSRLQAEAVEGVAAQTDWKGFTDRVAAAFAAIASEPAAPADYVRQMVGDRLRERWDDIDAAHRAELAATTEQLTGEIGFLKERLALSEIRFADAAARLDETHARMVGTVRQLQESQAAVAAARQQAADAQRMLDAYRNRLANRMIDSSPVGAVWRRVRRPAVTEE